MQVVLSLEPVDFNQWISTFTVGISILLLMELYKYVRQKVNSI